MVNINSNNIAPANVPAKSKSPIILNGNKITQDEQVIGKFRQDTTSSNYSQKTVLIMVYSSVGEKVAEASVPVANPQEWTIKILSENKSYNIMYDSPQERENLFKWFVDKNYLVN